MKKVFYITLALLLLSQASFGQKASTFQDSAANYFDEIKAEAGRHQQLWGKDLYGPLLLVDPNTRQLFANYPDSAGILKQSGNIYTGQLPNEINIANTAIRWNGTCWAMIMLPLPASKQERISLLAHELFHVAQPSLGFLQYNTENKHLDQRNGRIYLRLELEALKKAVQSKSTSEQKIHLANALTFRKYRYMLYKDADTTENQLELNEGIAEYTGQSVSAISDEQSIASLEQSINSFYSNPTFVRSFPYQTIPAYGYLLAKVKSDWNKEITSQTNLTSYFATQLGIQLPKDIEKSVERTSDQYGGQAIISEEKAREEKTKKQVAEFKRKFIEQPHFEIGLMKMQVAFDPRNIMPLEDKGTVYPTIRVSDSWGVLTVKNGALMNPSWNKISVTPPLKIKDRAISGDGWTLELQEGYTATKDEKTGCYKLSKK
ncbi:hypothetical protein [uncultured Acetobacteroides sp.]|uniref:hypothetical protein n=1 Tax=uncultured Acetobacteroides sp. TaxID=1760811 RepID=UPI0029F5A52C|nr:hypothetical protein [uncultured Acetobacteroides sp.]